MPKARLPASLPRTFRFNETVGIDLAEVENPWGTKHVFTNLVCWGTLLQLWGKTECKTTIEVVETMIASWVQYFGLPATMIADLSPEFTWKEFQGNTTSTESSFTSVTPYLDGKMHALSGTVA